MWSSSGINNSIINSNTTSLEEKIGACLQITTSSRLAHLQDRAIWTLWRLWKLHNLLIFQQNNTTWNKVNQQAASDATEWRTHSNSQIHQPSQTRHFTRARSPKQWRRPQLDWIKCNVDGSYLNAATQSKAGWILRDSTGTYKGAGQAIGNRVNNAFETELQALIIAMQHCWSQGHKKVIFESDCRKMINVLNQQGLHFDGYNWFREINWWRKQFHDIKFTWTSREGNKIADILAKNPLPTHQTFIFHYYVPVTISHMLHQDYVMSFI